MVISPQCKTSAPGKELSRAFSPVRLAAWLAIVLVLSKGFSLDRPRDFGWLRDLSMASFGDVLFALGLGAVANLALQIAGQGTSSIAVTLRGAFVTIFVLCAFYSVVAAGVFNYFGRPLSYDLLKLVHGVGAVESSIRGRITLPVAIALIGVPGGYYALTCLARSRKPPVFLVVGLLAWSAFGCWQYYQGPKPYFMPHLSVNPHIELVRSTWKAVTGLGKPSLQVDYPREYQDEFKPGSGRQTMAELSADGRPRPTAKERDRHCARVGWHEVPEPLWEPLRRDSGAEGGGRPCAGVREFLRARAVHLLLVYGAELFYLPRHAVALRAWGHLRANGPRALPPTLASMLKKRGSRTAYLNNGDLEWAGMGWVLKDQGYDIIEDCRAMGGATLTSWGAEDRVLFERLIRFIDEKPEQPFYALCWTDQTHDPYAVGPTSKMIDFFGEHVPTRHAEDLGRYLNVLHQLDQHLANLFRALRDRGLAEDTLVVITGDHGEAFGDPHDQRGHGFTAYQEDVNVPLILWNPRLFPGGQRVETVGGHVDLGATLADLLGFQPSEEWQGHSMFDPARPSEPTILPASASTSLAFVTGNGSIPSKRPAAVSFSRT